MINKDTLNAFLNKYRTVNSVKKRIEWCKTRPKYQDDIPYLEVVYEERLKEENERAVRKKEEEEEVKKKRKLKESLKLSNRQNLYEENKDRFWHPFKYVGELYNVVCDYEDAYKNSIFYGCTIPRNVYTIKDKNGKIHTKHKIIKLDDGGMETGKEIEPPHEEILNNTFGKYKTKETKTIWEPNGSHKSPDFGIPYKDGDIYYGDLKSCESNKEFMAGINPKLVDAMRRGDKKSLNTFIVIQVKEMNEDKTELTMSYLRFYPAVMLIKYTIIDGKVYISWKAKDSSYKLNEKQLYQNNWTFEDCVNMLQRAEVIEN